MTGFFIVFSASLPLSARAWIPRQIRAWVARVTQKQSESIDSTNKKLLIAQGFLGLGWFSKSEKPQEEVTPELEQKVLHDIATAGPDNFGVLNEYAKKYRSHASIRNVLMQKAVDVPEKELINEKQRILARHLISHMDPTCDPRGIVQWIVKLEQQSSKFKSHKTVLIVHSNYGNRFHQMLEDVTDEYLGFKHVFKKTGVIKEVIRSAALQNKDFILDGLTEDEQNMFLKNMTIDDMIVFCLYNAPKYEENQAFAAVTNKLAVRLMCGNIVFSEDLSPDDRKSFNLNDAVPPFHWPFLLQYSLELYSQRTWLPFWSTPPLDAFVMDCINNDKIQWLEHIFSNKHHSSESHVHCTLIPCHKVFNVREYLSQKNFKLLISYIESQCERISWQVYNNLRMHPEIRIIALARLYKADNHELLEFMSQCKELILDDASFHDYIIKERMMGDGDLEFQKKLFKHFVHEFEGSFFKIKHYAKPIEHFWPAQIKVSILQA